MPLSILKEFADVVDGFWRDNREESALQIHKLAEKELESDVPSRRWVSDRVKELKATARGLGPEPIASPWGKQWPKDAASVEALFVLHHEAMSLCESVGMRNFQGLTTRMAKWACKIRNFFDLSVRFDRLIFLQFTVWFAGQERWGEERDGDDVDPYISTLTASLGLMAWDTRDSETSQSKQKRWGHVFRIWEWEEDEVVNQVAQHLAGHILSIAASRRTTPIFDQQQVETDLEELISREQPEEDDEFDWLDTP